MKLGKLNNPRSAIGLDIGAHAVKAVQLEGPPGDQRLAAAASIPRSDRGPTDAELVRWIKDVLDRQGFRGDRAVLAVPPEKLVSSVLELPPDRTGAPREQIARMELSSVQRLDPERIELGLWGLPTGARQSRDTDRVMAAACTHEDADALLDVCERGGFEVAALDVEAAALARAYGLAERGDGQIHALLDLGWDSALLVLLHGGVVIYDRRLDESGLKHLHAWLCDELELEPDVVDYLLREVGLHEGGEQRAADQAVLSEVQTAIRSHYQRMVEELLISLSYATHQHPDADLTGLALLGGGAGLPGIDELLQQETELPARTLGLTERIRCPDSLDELTAQPVLMPALGLAMHPEAA